MKKMPKNKQRISQIKMPKENLRMSHWIRNCNKKILRISLILLRMENQATTQLNLTWKIT